jgi:ATPase subunit of ABC transporter with duplicated ATPase domains
VLLLDEPTNHLDLEAIEALVDGLESYDGSLILVSHDRWFVSQLATRIIEISPKGINDFRGTYDEYVERCGDDHLDVEQVVLRQKRDKTKPKGEEPAAVVLDPAAEKQRRKRRQELEKTRDGLTAEIEKAESRVHAINEMFCNPGFFDKTPETEQRQLEREQKTLAGKIEELMAAWEKAEAELSQVG